MTEFNEDDLSFVAGKYSEDRFDPKLAISRFKGANNSSPAKRIIISVAACAASFVMAFAGGDAALHRFHSHTPEVSTVEVPTVTTVLNPDVEKTHVFVYEDAPLNQVLEELSSHFGCKLSCSAEGKHLSGTFSDDDLEFIVSCIESVLGVKIMIER